MKSWLLGISALLLAAWMIFFYAPIEASQGLVQKIFYVHVASAFVMYVGFFIGFVAGLMYLWERKSFWEDLQATGIELGFLFCLCVLTTGPIWAKPIWGTYWTWEPRLTTTFLLFLVYAAYLTMRSVLRDHPNRAVISSLIAIVAFVDVPLIHYSVRIWRGIHPSVINNKDGGLPVSMQQTLALTFGCLLIWFGVLFAKRYRIMRAERAKLLRDIDMEESHG